jgi:hypothetical protein
MSTAIHTGRKPKHASSRADSRQEERIRIRAARLRVTTDKKLGRQTPAWVEELAKQKL